MAEWLNLSAAAKEAVEKGGSEPSGETCLERLLMAIVATLETLVSRGYGADARVDRGDDAGAIYSFSQPIQMRTEE